MSLSGKVLVMTGATSGLGVPGALTFAKEGARLIIIARSEKLAEKLINDIKAQATSSKTTAAAHKVVIADLASLADVQRAVQEICAAEPVIHYLVNNAGALFSTRRLSADGYEKSFAVNQLSMFALTLGLEGPLAAANGARVVITASFTHKDIKYHGSDLMWETRNYEPNNAYRYSKLYNIYLTRSLAKRWADKNITVNCFDPGLVDSGFSPGELGFAEPLLRLGIKLLGRSREKGAETMVWLVTSPDVKENGKYFKDKKLDKSITNDAQNDEYAEEIWAKTQALYDEAHQKLQAPSHVDPTTSA